MIIIVDHLGKEVQAPHADSALSTPTASSRHTPAHAPAPRHAQRRHACIHARDGRTKESTGAHRCWPWCDARIDQACSCLRHANQNVSISPLQRPVSACVCALKREGSIAQTSKEDWSRNCATPARLSLSGGSTANVDETRSCVDRRHLPSSSQTRSRKRRKDTGDGALPTAAVASPAADFLLELSTPLVLPPARPHSGLDIDRVRDGLCLILV